MAPTLQCPVQTPTVCRKPGPVAACCRRRVFQPRTAKVNLAAPRAAHDAKDGRRLDAPVIEEERNVVISSRPFKAAALLKSSRSPPSLSSSDGCLGRDRTFPAYRQSRNRCASGCDVRLAHRRTSRALARTRGPGRLRRRRRGVLAQAPIGGRTASIAIPTPSPKESSRAATPNDSLATDAPSRRAPRTAASPW